MLRRNVPSWERLIRIGLGVAIAVYSLLLARGPEYALAAMGVCVTLTGFIGFCPACALVGRGRQPG